MTLAVEDISLSTLEEMPPRPDWLLSSGRQHHGPLDDFDIVELARSARRMASWATSIELGAIAELSARRKAQGEKLGAWDSEVGEWVTDEIAAALTLSCGTAAHRVVMAQQLATTLPLTFEALRDGRIDADKTKAIADGLRGLPPRLAGAVERQVLPAAPAQTCAQLRYAVRKAIRDIDPDGCAERRELAEDARRLELWDSDAGTSDLTGRDLPATAATAAWNRINAIAAALRADGDPRTIDQLRADVFVALLRNERPTVQPPDDHADAELRPVRSPGIGPGGQSAASGLSDVVDASGSGGDECPAVWPDGSCADAELRPVRSPDIGPGEQPGTSAAPDIVDDPGPGARERTAVWPDGSCADGALRLVRSPDVRPNGQRVADGLPEVADASGSGTMMPSGVEDARAVADVVADELRDQLTGLSAAAGRRGGQATLVREAVRRIKTAAAELNARWCTTDGLRHGADSYRVPAGTCRFPGCRRKAAGCDADHTEPHHKGGPTCLCNLAILCRRHHRLKQRPEWQLIQVWHGVLVWIAPTGHWYVISPSMTAATDP